MHQKAHKFVYDIRFFISNRLSKANEVGYDMVWQYLKFEPQDKKHEGKN